jgi:predicted regulator of Ras-like GTPase activity (Roadblock/LC7/MglB family)
VEGQEGKGGVFTGEAGESVFAFLVAIHESGNKLGQLLMVLRFKDEAVPGATHTLAVA